MEKNKRADCGLIDDEELDSYYFNAMMQIDVDDVIKKIDLDMIKLKLFKYAYLCTDSSYSSYIDADKDEITTDTLSDREIWELVTGNEEKIEVEDDEELEFIEEKVSKYDVENGFKNIFKWFEQSDNMNSVSLCLFNQLKKNFVNENETKKIQGNLNGFLIQ